MCIDNRGKKKRKITQYTAPEFLSSYYAVLGIIQQVLIMMMLNSNPGITATSQTLYSPGSSGVLRLIIFTMDSMAIAMWLLNFIFLVMVHSLTCSKMNGLIGNAEKILRYCF